MGKRQLCEAQEATKGRSRVHLLASCMSHYKLVPCATLCHCASALPCQAMCSHACAAHMWPLRALGDLPGSMCMGRGAGWLQFSWPQRFPYVFAKAFTCNRGRHNTFCHRRRAVLSTLCNQEAVCSQVACCMEAFSSPVPSPSWPYQTCRKQIAPP